MIQVDRWALFGSSAALGTALCAPPLWARGPASFPAPNGFADRVAGAEFAVVPGAAHSLFSDRPEETIGVLRPWLQRQDAA